MQVCRGQVQADVLRGGRGRPVTLRAGSKREDSKREDSKACRAAA